MKLRRPRHPSEHDTERFRRYVRAGLVVDMSLRPHDTGGIRGRDLPLVFAIVTAAVLLGLQIVGLL